MEQKAISSDLIRGHIDTIILYSLMDGDKFAQQISDSIEEKSNGDYKMNQATLYSSLKRLETLKFVKSYWFDSESGRRKFFSITDSGKKTVQENLDSWSFSRALIDKLVDCEPSPIYKTQVVEKIVEVPVEVQVEKIVEIPVEVPVNTVVQSDVVNAEKPSQIVEEKPVVQEVVKTDSPAQSSQEINFRNILNGLIKSSAPKKEERQVVELKPVNKEIFQENTSEKLNFKDTISNVDYNERKTNNNGKIDFGDLMLKAAKEGYKIRISSKDSSISSGKLLINKLNFSAVLLTFFVALIEFLVCGIAAGGLLKLNALSVIGTLVVLAVAPVVYLVNYLKNPNKSTNKTVGTDGMLTSAIVVFNLILITFAICLLSSADLTNKLNLLAFVFIPGAIYFDILLYSVVKFILAKHKIFNNKSKK